MPQVDPFLYIVLDDSVYDPVREVYDATIKSVDDIITNVFIITRKGSGSGLTRIEWEAQAIPLNNVTFELTYDSGIPTISNVPKNVGRYDYTIKMTYIRNIVGDSYNGTYRNFFTTNYFVNKPNDIPSPDDSVYSDPLFSTETGFPKPQRLKNTYKFLMIDACPVTINFIEDELAYSGNTLSPKYTTSPQLLDPTDPNAPGNVPMRLMYSGNSVVAPLAAPIEIGTYEVTATSIDFNYVGTATSTFTIRNLTTTESAAINNDYQEKTDLFTSSISKNNTLSNSSFASYSEGVSTTDFIKSGVLTMIEKADIPALGTVKTLAECAQNLPQKLMIFAAAKIAQFVLSYIPGLGIIKLLTSIMEVIQQVQKILALIEFIKDNPWAFLNSVLEATGVYDKIGTFANEQVEALKSQFPGITEGISDVAGFVKDVANGLVDICNAVDIHGNPISQYIKADNTKVPSAIAGFIPATSRQPSEAKGKYDLFQFRLRDALYKDNDKIAELKNEGNTAGLEEYVSMLTAVHELAYNYHDSVAATGSGSGLLSSSSTTADGLDSVYNILGQATNILSSVVPQTSSTAATSTTTSGSTQRSTFSVDSLNSGLTTAANAIGGVASSIGAVGSFLSGETGFSLVALKNEFNYFADNTLAKNPTWSPETVKEYKKRVNKIKYEIENNADAIRNNPANAGFAQASGIEAANSSSGSSPTSFLASAFKGSPLASSFLGK